MELLKRLGIWFVSGFGLGAGVLLAIWLGTYLDKPRSTNIDVVDDPKDIEVAEVAQVPFTSHLVVTGNLNNRGKRIFDGGWLEIAVQRNGKAIYRCTEWERDSIKPGSSIPFQVQCEDVERQNIPTDAELRVSVKGATFKQAGGV